MWCLISTLKPDEKHVFLCGKEYIFGRKDCDVILSGDPAVSRRHASIQVTHSETNLAFPDKLPIIILKDLSKFGTWASAKRIEGEVILKDGDEVFFGSPKSSYMVVYEPFIVTTSCLDSANKKSVRSLICKIGGHVVTEWRNNCCLLVMNSISVTIKVICGLLSQIHIVTPDYIEQYYKYLTNNGTKPYPADFLPSAIESQVNSGEVSFLPNIQRKTVFQSMKFIFLSGKQFKKMNIAIELGGGMSVLLDEGLEDNPVSILYDNGSIVMSLSEDINTLSKETKLWYQQVVKILNKKKKYMIGDSEIGYAVLYCSTDKHCNPNIPAASQQVMPDIKSQSLSTDISFETSDILAINTELTHQGKKKEKKIDTSDGVKVIDETFIAKKSENDKNSPSSSKKSSDKSLPVTTTEIKEEPITQNTPKQDRRTSKRNRSPSPNSVMTPSMVMEDSSVKVEPVSSKKQRRSPSPKPFLVKETEKLVIENLSVKKVTENMKNITPLERTRPKRHRSPSPANDQGNHRSPSTAVTEKTKNITPSERSPAKRTRSPSPADVQDNGATDSRRSGVSSNKEIIKRERTPAKRTRSPSPADDQGDGATNSKRSVSSNKEMIKRERPMKEEDISVIDHHPSSPEAVQENVSTEVKLPDGFLTTRKPIKTQVIKSEEYMYINELPERLIVTTFTDLIKRRPNSSTTVTRGEAVPDGYIKWKGKLVKNFKKFKKVSNAGSHALPNIIGGSDLQVHVADRSKEIEDWFQQTVRAESQLNEEEKHAQLLFDYKPNQKKRR